MILRLIIKNGFTNSIGWNLGNIYKSIYLLDPLTSIPIIGTKNKKSNDNVKIIIEILNNFSFFINDRKKITKIPKRIKIKCLKKKE